MFKYTANELSAPDAEHKANLFDWQMENAGAKTIEKFGGLNHLAQTLGTDLLKVFIMQYYIFKLSIGIIKLSSS